MRHLDKAVFTTAHFHHIVCGFKMVIRPAVRNDLCKFLIIIAPSGIKERFGRKDHKMIRDQLLWQILSHDRDFFRGDNEEIRCAAVMAHGMVPFQIWFSSLFIIILSSLCPEIGQTEDISSFISFSHGRSALWSLIQAAWVATCMWESRRLYPGSWRKWSKFVYFIAIARVTHTELALGRIKNAMFCTVPGFAL